MMREKRALILGAYNSALDGLWTTTELKIGQPEIYEETIEVPGMHGVLDFSEAPVGHPVYKQREITAAFESSAGTVEEREDRITAFLQACHGRRVRIVVPDYPDRYTIGRVYLEREFNNLAYARVSMKAKCDPFFLSDLPETVSLPILSSAVNAISAVEIMESTAAGGYVAPSDRATWTFTAESGEVGTYAVFRLTVQPNTEYYVSGKLTAKGYWRISATQTMPPEWSPFATTGADGYLYLWVNRLTPVNAVPLTQVVVIPRENLQVISTGAAHAETSCSKPDGVWLVVSVNGKSYPHFGVVDPQLTLDPGDCVAVAMRYDQAETAEYESISWHRRWI